MSTKFQVSLSDDLATELRRLAARLGVDTSQFVTETVKARLMELREEGGDAESMYDIADSGDDDDSVIG